MPFLKNPIFCAVDTIDLPRATRWARELEGYVGGIKIGLEFFYAHGHFGYEMMATEELPIFLDLKVHDIPNTVAGCMRALMELDPIPSVVNVHAMGGYDMMRAAADAVAGRSRLFGVTVPTSLDGADLTDIGFSSEKDAGSHAARLAELAHRAGLDGVVCGSGDVESVLNATSPDFLTIVPGIRPAGTETDDQKRFATPTEAVRAGADVLVVGRPITQARSPVKAAKAIFEEVEKARG